ncbi:predicted protein [Postia placenta Mad-698-R]|uniref:Uncharacterized protein n=1 Tax=Postia placenta MAD-698-R-SB12 TaxID=670580 RepID=A0A1X6NBN3_9APHY|nr:hypothetical protein POSPLADRAFT_1133305 [Postia placenta MAD-698-R-SB12]EED77967.1 predicted protein [Postia placenta Mad-698-R]OSX66045.1 hypothetical protein POSPLADRAFT_1133305 [Postia placenta MAD-698-R-SB12]
MVRLLSNFIIPRCLHVPDEAEQPDWDMNVLVIPSERMNGYMRITAQPGEVVFDINLGKLMDGLPQLDAILSAPTFDGLTDVDVDVRILDGPDAERDEELAHELRLCLPRLDARVNLAIGFNGILYAARRARRPPFSRRRLSRIGLDWDEDAGKLRCHRIERVSAQDAVVANEETSAEDDRCTNNATTGRILHEAAAYVDAERPSSSNPMDARVPSQPVCDDEPVPPHATAGLGMSVDISAPDNHDDELSALPGSVA